MSSDTLGTVTLRGGRADGRRVQLPSARTVHAVIVGEEERVYPPGEYGAGAGVVIATVTEFDVYRRADECTFEHVPWSERP